MLEQYPAVDAALRAEIDGLIEAAATQDGFVTELYTDFSVNVRKDMDSVFVFRVDGQLRGCLVLFAPTADVVEISALVHPEERGKGVFKALLEAAAAESRRAGYTQGLVACNELSPAVQFLPRWGCTLSHTEYQMEFSVIGSVPLPDPSLAFTRLTLDDVPDAAPLMAACFGNDAPHEETYLRNSLSSQSRTNWALKRQGRTVGFCGCYQEGQVYYVFGVGVLPEERRMGYGRAMLDRIVNLAAGNGIKQLRLDVDSSNPNAFSLYESYGFRKQSATRYYSMRL